MDNGASSYRRFLSGDKNALIDIIYDYRKGLVLFINSIINDFCTAEEIAEDTFLKLYVDKPVYKEVYTFKTWLYTIAKNLAVDHLRKLSKHKNVSADAFYSIQDKENIETDYIKNETKRHVLRALDKLNDEYRQVLYLVYFEQFSNTETAEIMGKSERQIRNLLYRSKEKMRNILERSGFEYEKL